NALGRAIASDDCYDRYGIWKGVKFGIPRPNIPTLLHVQPLLWPSFCCIARLDIALNFSYSTEHDQNLVRSYLAQHVKLKWKPHRPRWWWGNTVYWLPPNRPNNRNLVLYRKASTIVRLELRYMTAQSVGRAKLSNIPAIISLNPAEHFRRNVSLV